MAKGFHYAIGIRALLDNCRTTNEAVDFLQHIPIGSAVNIIVADKAGSAALVEIAGRKRATKTISSDTPEQYLISTNKYNLLDIPIQSQEAIQNTTIRYDAAERWLKANAGRISKEALRGFLAKEYPEGFCGGVTLWSMVFDAAVPPANGR
jgi:predicted choloylglycine hydrolase